jgi:hypothetical protein
MRMTSEFGHLTQTEGDVALDSLMNDKVKKGSQGTNTTPGQS